MRRISITILGGLAAALFWAAILTLMLPFDHIDLKGYLQMCAMLCPLYGIGGAIAGYDYATPRGQTIPEAQEVVCPACGGHGQVTAEVAAKLRESHGGTCACDGAHPHLRPRLVSL